MSFKDVYGQIYYDLIDQGISEEEAEQRALEGATDTFATMADLYRDQQKDNPELLRS